MYESFYACMPFLRRKGTWCRYQEIRLALKQKLMRQCVCWKSYVWHQQLAGEVLWLSQRTRLDVSYTAESELAASVEGALALVSIESLLKELNLGEWNSLLRTDSTSSLFLQKGSGSWRTRHLHIKSNWIGERLQEGDLRLEHWPRDHMAHALTKSLSSLRLREISKNMGYGPDAAW